MWGCPFRQAPAAAVDGGACVLPAVAGEVVAVAGEVAAVAGEVVAVASSMACSAAAIASMTEWVRVNKYRSALDCSLHMKSG